jgi:hypothetical protein
MEARLPGASPRVVITGDEVRLGAPDRMPLSAVMTMLAFCAAGLALVAAIVYFGWDEFPVGNGGLIAIASVVAFFGLGGVVGGFVGGWYMTKSKGPLATHRLGSDEIHFPQMNITLKRDAVVALEFVNGGYLWKRADTGGWARARLRQTFCHVRGTGAARGERDENEKRVIVHATSINVESRWRDFAREVGLRFERHDLPREKWPRVE